MRQTFRSFVRGDKLVRFLGEADAPVQGAVATSPTNPDTSPTDHHLGALERGLGIDGSSLKAGLEGAPQTLIKVPYYKSWGFIVNGPCPAQATKEENGNYKVKYLFSLLPKTAFFLPPKVGQEQAEFFDAPVEDKEVTMSAKEYQAMIAQPLQMMPQGGLPQAGGGPMGGGAGGAMGGMGGSPMGGL